MRPNAMESVHAAQVALAEVIAPGLTSAFALDSAQTVQMLLESLASELDSAAENLSRDNETLRSLLSEALNALRSAPTGNESVTQAVSEIEQRLREDGATSVVLSDL